MEDWEKELKGAKTHRIYSTMGLCDNVTHVHWGPRGDNTETHKPEQLWTAGFGHNPCTISLFWVLMKQKEENNEAQTVQTHIPGEQFPSEPHCKPSKQQELGLESRHWHFPGMPTLGTLCFMTCVALLGLQVFVVKENKWIWGGEREEHKTSKCKPTLPAHTQSLAAQPAPLHFICKEALNPWTKIPNIFNWQHSYQSLGELLQIH